ncbi:MAG: hypothetical protein LQ348_002551 [Seirophora lacunosa]|nr:MAG: hypothetical protein LQ348_002551 [Seirophora lacunosa]
MLYTRDKRTVATYSISGHYHAAWLSLDPIAQQMYSFQRTVFIFYAQVLLFIIHGLALNPLNQPLASRPELPDNAPPPPWAQYICKHPHVDDMILTFKWGQPLPADNVQKILESADTLARHLIFQGSGKSPVRNALSLGTHPRIDIAMWVVPFKEHIWSRNEFTVFRASDALQLVEYCGWQSGHYAEMWAFVVYKGAQIGFAWLAHDDRFIGGNQQNVSTV